MKESNLEIVEIAILFEDKFDQITQHGATLLAHCGVPFNCHIDAPQTALDVASDLIVILVQIGQ